MFGIIFKISLFRTVPQNTPQLQKELMGAVLYNPRAKSSIFKFKLRNFNLTRNHRLRPGFWAGLCNKSQTET